MILLFPHLSLADGFESGSELEVNSVEISS